MTPTRHQFVLGEVAAERHTMRCFAGEYDEVSGPITEQERAEAEQELTEAEGRNQAGMSSRPTLGP